MAMTTAVSDLKTLLATMSPRLNEKHVAYVTTQTPIAIVSKLSEGSLIGSFVEPEGTTLFIELQAAEDLKLPVLLRAAWITLTVHSALEAFGLTAAFAKALADEQISSNVVAAAFHDHIFVPVADADRTMAALKKLQMLSV